MDDEQVKSDDTKTDETKPGKEVLLVMLGFGVLLGMALAQAQAPKNLVREYELDSVKYRLDRIERWHELEIAHQAGKDGQDLKGAFS